MEQQPIIFAILRPVTKPYPQLDKRYEKIVFVDPDSLISFQEIPIHRFWKKHNSFWISCQTFASFKNVKCNIDDFDTNKTIVMDIAFRIKMISGREHLAALFLHKESNPDKFIVDKLITWVLHFANNQKDFSSNYFELEKDMLKSLNDEAFVHGMELQISITPQDITRPQDEFALIKHNTICQIRDCEVNLVCTMVMNLIDARRFRMAQISNLDKWLKEQLDRIVQNILIEKTFAQLLQKFDENEIQKRLSEEVYHIGYAVKQLISVPDIEMIQLKDGFTFNTEDGNSPETPSLYNTRDRRLPVSLDATVKGKISSFDGNISDHLKPQVNLVSVMRTQVIETIRHFIQGITPERFYLHFSSKYKGEIAFEVELEQKVALLLEQNFNVKNLSVIISPLDTLLTKRFHGLESKFGKFECQSMSERVKYDVKFSVRNVHPDGWYTFKSKKYDDTPEGTEDELREIGKTLKSYMEATLNSITNIDLMVRRDNRFDTLMEELFRRAAEKVTLTLGLVVECISLDRCKVDEDDFYNRMLEEKGRQFMEQEYERILTQAKDMLETRSGDALSMLNKHEKENILPSESKKSKPEGITKQNTENENKDSE
jgi:hypothetical protein